MVHDLCIQFEDYGTSAFLTRRDAAQIINRDAYAGRQRAPGARLPGRHGAVTGIEVQRVAAVACLVPLLPVRWPLLSPGASLRAIQGCPTRELEVRGA